MPVTAHQGVRRIRELIQLIEGTTQAYRDGFVSDDGGSPDPDKIPLLPSLNDFLHFCSLAGAKADNRAIPVVAGTREYIREADVVNVLQVYFNGSPLWETTRSTLDRTDPLWTTLTGTPKRWFSEGNQIILDRAPDSGLMTLRIALPLKTFDGTNPTDTYDSALSDVQASRVPYGAAYLVMNIDAMNNVHQKRLDNYKRIGDGLLSEIQGSGSNFDYSRAVSLDDWEPQSQRGRGVSEDIAEAVNS